MELLPVMIGVSLFLGGVGLIAFLWGIRSGQFDDPEGMRYRVILDDEDEEHYQKKLRQKSEDSKDCESQ